MRHDSRTALYCHEYLHKTYAPNQFDLSLRLLEGADPIADEYKRLGRNHEEEVLAKIRAGKLNVVQLDLSETYDSREIQTAKALLRTDIDILLGASIGTETENELRKVLGASRCPGDDDRVSRPDLLVRVGADGEIPIWAPVDVKSHSAMGESKTQFVEETDLELNPISTVDPVKGRFGQSDALQLAHYMKHLRNIGLAPSDLRAGLIGRDGQKIVWAKLDQVRFGGGKNAPDALTLYAEKFLKAKSLISDAIRRNDDSSVQVDSMARMETGDFGCGRCEFKNVCQEEMDNFDNGQGHVTLLAKVTPKVRRDHFPEIESIRELREASTLDEVGELAKIRARVWQTGVPELLKPNEGFSIPIFDVEIDIDLENSQAVLFEAGIDEVAGKDQVYLYGYGVLDRTVNTDWRTAHFDSFSNYEDSVEAEIDVQLRMWNFLKEQVAKAKAEGKTVGIFHYSTHEVTWWKKFAVRHAAVPGTPTLNEVETFIADYFNDLLPYSRMVALKATGYGIKFLAPLAGFEWDVDDPGGAGSLLKYRDAIDENKTEIERQAAKDWLYSYNLDDVRATFAVREYLRGLERGWS